MRFDVAKLISERMNELPGDKDGWVIELEDMIDGPIICVFGCNNTGLEDFVMIKEDGSIATGSSVGLPMRKLPGWLGAKYTSRLNTEERAIACYHIIKQYMLDEDDYIGLAHDWDEAEFIGFHFPQYADGLVDE